MPLENLEQCLYSPGPHGGVDMDIADTEPVLNPMKLRYREAETEASSVFSFRYMSRGNMLGLLRPGEADNTSAEQLLLKGYIDDNNSELMRTNSATGSSEM